MELKTKEMEKWEVVVGETGGGATRGVGAHAQRYRIDLPELPNQVPYRSLTMEVSVPAAWCRDPRVDVGREGTGCGSPSGPACCGLRAPVRDGTEVGVRNPSRSPDPLLPKQRYSFWHRSLTGMCRMRIRKICGSCSRADQAHIFKLTYQGEKVAACVIG